MDPSLSQEAESPKWAGCVCGHEDWSLKDKVDVLEGTIGRGGVEPLLEP